MVTMFVCPSGMQKLETKCMLCVRESPNECDRYAVVVVKDGVLVGLLPKVVSMICSLFLHRGGKLHERWQNYTF